MSENDNLEDDEEQQKKVKKPIIPITKKVFLNDMNSSFSNFVIDNMRTDLIKEVVPINYEFMGTRRNTKHPLPRLFVPKEIKIDYNYNYQNPIFENDVFIFNLDRADFKEIDYIIKGLKAWQYESEKVLVIVSSIMIWARTPPKYRKENEEPEPEEEENQEGEDKEKQEKKPEEEEEKEPESEEEEYVLEEEPEGEEEEKKEEAPIEEGEEGKEPEEPKKILYFKEKDFIKRIPSQKFYHNKMVETLAWANTNPKLKTYIVCSGFIYGCGEDLFYDYFKMAWLEQPDKLPIILKGKNTIPTIHIKDLVSLIRRIVETTPKNKYIFAIDHTKNRQLKNIITAISKGVGTGIIENLDEKDKSRIPHFDELSIDIKARPTKLFLDEKRDDEEDEEFEKRTFKWHCEFGIPENIEKLRQEFNDYRGWKNVKWFITGPPGCGKSYIGEKISKFYNIPHIKIKDVLEWGKKLTDELGEEIKAKLEEIENAVKEAQEAYDKRPNRKTTDPPLDWSGISKFPDEILVKWIRRRLAMNICRNRGYVLDGYPRSYKNAFSIFNEDTDESKPPEDPTKYKLLTEITPNSVILLDNCSEEYLMNRLKESGDIKEDSIQMERRLNRRIKAYNLANNSEWGEPSVTHFFVENKIDVLRVDGTLHEAQWIDQSKVFIERNGHIDNYQIFDSIVEKEVSARFAQVHKGWNEEIVKEQKENEFYDNEKEEVKDKFDKEKRGELEKHEKGVLEKKSEVLRRYLAENVIPVLSKGISEICNNIPGDPVDALAQYWWEHANNAKFPPQKYKDQ